ncbi:N-acetylmuramic acid 6-phosphate etherase [Alkalicoccus luteus]|uniref:N-acetylmuramic acid 6-phosphate etherase n=1 Tax=Alkalicoccus luteus TaxID=1237094 RepID=A0A969PT06_9BACI|nr:N-acetylmuramic acid 6-phosphate etherase [Alkalicoccus luteus]NJP38549.1 N-acetylmuramic acid 6-phosphate etherase [Alkalicoccus luteus]
MGKELSALLTEQRNPASMRLSDMTTAEMLKTMNQEDKKVADAVAEALPAVEKAVELIVGKLQSGGRLFYVGAGTSGRLGYMDSSECPPTFMTEPEMVQTVMAGGDGAVEQAKENSEDDGMQGRVDLQQRQLRADDAVVGITASGRTPYPIGALTYAREIGAAAVSLSCNPQSEISAFADAAIEVITGPEVLTGSTRLKAGSAHKMVLNMISTSAMVKLGKVHENLMVDVHASNYKLRERAKQIVSDLTGVTTEEAERVLEAASWKVKPAIVMIKAGVGVDDALEAIRLSNGCVKQAASQAQAEK